MSEAALQKTGYEVNILASARISMFMTADTIAVQVTASTVENLDWNILQDFLFIYKVCLIVYTRYI